MTKDPFQGYYAKNKVAETDPFAGYYAKNKVAEIDTSSPAPVNYKKSAAALAKGAISGALGAIPDIASSLYNLPASAVNYANKIDPELFKGTDFYPMSRKRADLPLIPSTTAALEKGIDTLTGGYTETPENIKHLYEGTKLAGAVAGPGGIGAITSKVAPKVIGKALGALGSTKPSAIAGGATAGAAMSKLQDEGYSPTTQIAASLGAGALTGAGITSLGRLRQPLSPFYAVSGLSKKRLNLKAAKAARDLGIELPASAFTDSKATMLADQLVGATPYLGNKLRDKYLKADEEVIKKLNQFYNKTGPQHTEKVSDEISKLYNKVEDLLPSSASVYAENTANAISKIEKSIKTSTLSPSEQNLLSRISDIKNKLVPYRGVSAPVDFIVGTKKSLNQVINWEEDKGIKKLLRNVQQGLLKDIEKYGEKDPVWYKAFQDADRLFEKVEKRKRLEHLLSERAINDATGDISYNALSKVIHKKKTREELKRITSPEVFEKIDKLGEVARTMAIKSKNIPNPSGSAIATSILGLVAGIFTAPLPTISTAMGLGAGAKLLTSQKFLDLAIKAAENPKNISLRQKLRKNVKDLTGMSIEALNNRIHNEQNRQHKRDLIVDIKPSDKYR